MSDQTKTPGAMVQITHEQLRDLVAGYCGPSALGDLYALADAPSEQMPPTDHIEDARATVEQTPAVGGEPATQTHVLRAMAHNYRNGHWWDHLDGEACTKAADEITRLQARIAELEAQLAKANDWQHLKPSMDPAKP